MKVVIAIDSFKGSLSSVEAGSAAAEGISRAVPDDILRAFAGVVHIRLFKEGDIIGGAAARVVYHDAPLILSACTCFQALWFLFLVSVSVMRAVIFL